MLWKNFDHDLNQIELMRIHANRQRDQICQLRSAGIPTASAEKLLDRMLTRIEEMTAARRRLRKEQSAVVN
jgi:hypothetical protein